MKFNPCSNFNCLLSKLRSSLWCSKKALATATEELERIEAKKEALVEEQRREEEEERNGVLRIIRRCAHEPKVNPPFNLTI